MVDPRQTRLEELLAHQQHVIDTLDNELAEHRNELTRLSLVVKKLESKLKLLADYVQNSGDDLPHEKPPHY